MPQQGGKGNPASHRMGNLKRKERRAKSWARGERRKQERRKANEARMQANLDALAELGGERRQYERVVERAVFNTRTNSMEYKTLKRMKKESPGTALARTRRERG
jgi:Holliday junction resolvasome RuvABC DNA-binding subunit